MYNKYRCITTESLPLWRQRNTEKRNNFAFVFKGGNIYFVRPDLDDDTFCRICLSNKWRSQDLIIEKNVLDEYFTKINI